MGAFEHNVDEEEEERVKKSKKMVKVPTTLASIESLTFPLVQEVILLADYRCKMCQDRVADIISKFNGDMQSMEILMMEKRVILTFNRNCSKAINTHKNKLQAVALYKNMVNKISNIKRLLHSSWGT
uniref:uncharacterized protein LOC122580170 n=1 Tax=Erigeron canadensis TaxID=72917 RepID=UPI001CB97C46|nr:uncharacterized protein LOC122580170 [Erigeron canadensis]